MAGWVESPASVAEPAGRASPRCRTGQIDPIEAEITGQEVDGYFGPKRLKQIAEKNRGVVRGVRPHMLMIASGVVASTSCT